MLPLLLAALLHCCGPGKPVIDTNAVDHWPLLSLSPQISIYGNFLSYTTIYGEEADQALMIRSRRGDWHREFPGVWRCYFSGDEKLAVIARADSLLFVRPGRDSVEGLRAGSYQWPSSREGRWIAYKVFVSNHVLLQDLLAGTMRDLGEAQDYRFDPGGHFLVVEDRGNLDVIDLRARSRKRLWTSSEGDSARSFCWDERGGQLAFAVTGLHPGIWNEQPGSQPVKIVTGSIDGPFVYSRNGSWLFYLLKGITAVDTGVRDPLIWTWKDKSFERARVPGETGSWAAVATDGKRARRLEDSDQRLLTPASMVTGDWVLVVRDGAYSLLSLTDGRLRRIETSGSYPADFCFSPEGRWFVYYNGAKAQYVSVELSTGISRAITNGIPPGISSEFPHGVADEAVAQPAGWLRGDSAVLIYDNYDLWAVDPGGRRKPLNLSLGYGRRHHTKLRLFAENAGKDEMRVISVGDSLLLTAFNMRNKYNGFFRLMTGGRPAIDSLFMGPYTFYRVASQKPHQFSWDDGMRPVRSAAANVWLIRRESTTDAPNYFTTSDFRHFDRVTDYQPQAGYNWLTAELIDYTALDGMPSQGVLYKPENFDPAKRYPVIFTVYEQLSHRLYEFPRPELCRDNLNIPWFVSRGYLVFTPDIRYRPANRSNKTVGQWAYSSVVPAARRLIQLSFVDSKRMGIQGHSLGAEETNYLLTTSSLFAAAVEMAGPTDPVSAYLTLLPTGGGYPPETRESHYIWEHGQARIGSTLWGRPELYLRESAVLHADKISTPLLIVHNPQDGAVQGRQGTELFIALRRLGKPAWLLQYPDENHSILQRNNALDYTQRMVDFFGHFLQGQTLPGWMVSSH